MSLAFLEARISTKVSSGMHSTPTVPGRTKRYTFTRRLTQNYAAAFPLHKFDLAHGVKTAAEYQALLDLFYIVHFSGPYQGFRLRDWRDYELTQSNSRLTLISGSVYQINRVHSYGGVEFIRPIYKPEATGVVIKRNRAGTITTATATIDSTNGQATISDHSGGDTYTAEGYFDLPVTFSDDEWDAELIVAKDGILHVGGSIALEEIRL